jgi:hypothetical protein
LIVSTTAAKRNMTARSNASGVVARPQVCGEVVEGEFAGACVPCSGVSTRCAASEARPRARRSVCGASSDREAINFADERDFGASQFGADLRDGFAFNDVSPHDERLDAKDDERVRGANCSFASKPAVYRRSIEAPFGTELDEDRRRGGPGLPAAGPA